MLVLGTIRYVLVQRMLFTLRQLFFVKKIIVCLEFELGKQSGVFRLCGSLNDSDHVYHLQETTALLYPKSFHIGKQESCNELHICTMYIYASSMLYFCALMVKYCFVFVFRAKRPGNQDRSPCPSR